MELNTTTIETATIETATIETAEIETATIETATIETTPIETTEIETTPIKTEIITTTSIPASTSTPTTTTPTSTSTPTTRLRCTHEEAQRRKRESRLMVLNTRISDLQKNIDKNREEYIKMQTKMELLVGERKNLEEEKNVKSVIEAIQNSKIDYNDLMAYLASKKEC